MAPKENEKWTITDGPNRWDLVLTGLVGQQDLTFMLRVERSALHALTDKPFVESAEHFMVTAMVLEMGPAKCPFVTHVSDRSPDEWVLLLIFRDGPFKERFYSFYYDCTTRKGFMTERLYMTQTPPR